MLKKKKKSIAEPWQKVRSLVSQSQNPLLLALVGLWFRQTSAPSGSKGQRWAQLGKGCLPHLHPSQPRSRCSRFHLAPSLQDKFPAQSALRLFDFQPHFLS